ncbi:MAG: hypothetical protein PW790_04610 [Parvibaculaceae bacterium]|nr:hypothetical protein [Parvibaculaceae bacterium]
MTAADMEIAPPPLARWPLRRVVRWLFAGALALGLGLAIRYGFIQSREVGQICIAAAPPGWCGLTHLLWAVSHYSIWGVPALIAALFGFFRGSKTALFIALLLGLLGLGLYNADIASLALIITLLCLPRT